MIVLPRQAGWYPLARANEIKANRPLRRFLLDTPILLFGTPTSPNAIVDRCPHRGAPLSRGTVTGATVQCPYHGWIFDGSGALVAMPCLADALPAVRVGSFETCVRHGLVFVKLGDAGDAPYINPLADTVKFWRAMPGRAQTGLIDAAENFLDPAHTHFVHTHLVRSSKKVNPTRVEVTGAANRAEAHYYGEGATEGLVGTLMGERDRALSVGRFIGPNVAEVEFHGPRGVNFIMTGYLTPTRDGKIAGYGVVGLPGGTLWATIKFALLWPWIKLVHRQDSRVFDRIAENAPHFPSARPVYGPLDVLRPQIDAIVAGEMPPAHARPVNVTMNL